METSVGGYCAVLLPLSSPLSCPPSLFCYLQHPWNFSFLHTGSAWTFWFVSWCLCVRVCVSGGRRHTPFPHHCLWFIECLGGLMEVCPPGTSFGSICDATDERGARSFKSHQLPADRPVSPSLCQSLPFTGQLFFYQFPWRCACVHVCLPACVRACASVRG